ncbi:transcription initiation factor TFIID subunit 2-like [Saccostrea cucullata]|uniref:transcription initiation factor TFIID subunit 2-like n=1 Tax=Saccostrea cuccullata TaxID=36930 RepID=UPI002ED2C8AA
MKKEGKSDVSRPYKLAHQTLCIRAINLEKKSLIGYVELLIHPLRHDLKRVKINSKQCRIYHVSINDQHEAKFLYNDPTLEICQGDAKQRNLDYFQHCHFSAMSAVDPDNGNGEITVRLPPEMYMHIAELRPFRVCIEFSLENPKGGLHFVIPDIQGSVHEKAPHAFTGGLNNCSRLWFPCLDTYSEPCTWKIEVTVDNELTAVTCGDLIEVISTSDKKRKTFHYFLSVPTSAPNIGMAVGPFEIHVDPNMHEVTHFCLPHLSEILKYTTNYIHKAFEFYEELLSSRYPYSCYKHVFVDEAYEESTSYATLSILSTNLLHSNRIIDQTVTTRNILAEAIAKQFFGTFIAMQTWSDAWLPLGISGYLGGLFIKKTFGNNEYRFRISNHLKDVQEYENRVGGIVLDPTKRDSNHHFSIKSPHTVSPRYMEAFRSKSLLVIRMLEQRIGEQLLIQVFNKLVALASTGASQKFGANAWGNLLLSTSSFLKIISTVTGKDITPFLDLWVSQSGCARFFGNFVFNRKRNVVELELKQDLGAKGSIKYVGPLTVTIQELDGSFNHNFKIEENKTKFDITCHSKCRRNKKKKIPLMTGEEVDMDLSAMDADSPVLWLRVDPDMSLLSHVTWEQPDYMWQYQLRYERDIVAQREAIRALENYPTAGTRRALTDILEDDHCFYRIRMEAAYCLAKVANSMVGVWAGPPAMMTIFRKMFGSHSCPAIIRQNNFSNLQHYFLLKTIPNAMAMLRNIHTICPPEVFKFIMELFKYNDNSRNKFSDNYYRAALVEAVAKTVTPAITLMTTPGQGPTADNLSMETKQILEEITRYLNLEKLLPCYRHTVTVSCLSAIRTLQKFGHLPSEVEFFKSYARHGVFRDIRLAAIDAIVDFIKTESRPEDMYWILSLVETDPDLYIRHYALQQLVLNPPFRRLEASALHTEGLVERLWKMMKTFFRNMVVLNLKDKRNRMNPAFVPDEMEEMFDDEDEELAEDDNSQMDTETDIDVTNIGGEDSSLKRKSPPCSDPSVVMSLGSVPETCPEGIFNEDSTSQSKKLKLKMPSEPPVETSQVSELPSVAPGTQEVTVPKTPITPSSATSAYAAEFLKFVGVKQEPPAPESQMSITMDTSSRLSEGSSSPTNTPRPSESGAPLSFAGLLPSSASATDLSSATDSKAHKAKKKKKKNKHKHKHKHKHDRPDKDPLERIREGSQNNSSENSPSVQHSTLSSPEYEI